MEVMWTKSRESMRCTDTYPDSVCDECPKFKTQNPHRARAHGDGRGSDVRRAPSKANARIARRHRRARAPWRSSRSVVSDIYLRSKARFKPRYVDAKASNENERARTDDGV